MKHNKIVKAYKALTNLSAQRIPLNESLLVYKLKQKLKPIIEFSQQEETKIAEQFNPQVTDEGFYKFDSQELASGFSEAMKELYATEHDVEEINPISISTNDIKISADDIEALDGFVSFGGE